MKLARAFLICCAISLPAEAITVKDFAGREITLQQPAKRIVALAPHIVENLYSGTIAQSGSQNFLPEVMSNEESGEAIKALFGRARLR